MKHLALSLLFASLVLPACSSGGGGGNRGAGSGGRGNRTGTGTLTLAGTDTATHGVSIDIGDMATLHDQFDNVTYVFTDPRSTIRQDEYFYPYELREDDFVIGDPNNAFILMVAQNAETGWMQVQLIFERNGQRWGYAQAGFGGPNAPRAGLRIDAGARRIDMSDIQLEPMLVGTAPLTIDGTLVWD